MHSLKLTHGLTPDLEFPFQWSGPCAHGSDKKRYVLMKTKISTQGHRDIQHLDIQHLDIQHIGHSTKWTWFNKVDIQHNWTFNIVFDIIELSTFLDFHHFWNFTLLDFQHCESQQSRSPLFVRSFVRLHGNISIYLHRMMFWCFRPYKAYIYMGGQELKIE